MTRGDSEARLPATGSSDADPVLSAGLSIAKQWGEALGPEQLRVALEALEPQLKRDHRALMKRLEMQAAQLEQEVRERREERAHRRHMAGLLAGSGVAVAMLGAGVYVASDAWWLATFLCGPSLLALAKVFVLRRSDQDDMKFLSRTARSSTNAASQATQQPPVV